MKIKNIPEPLKNIDLQRTLRRNGVYRHTQQQEDLYIAARSIAKKFVDIRKKKQAYGLTEQQVQDFVARRLHIVDTKEEAFVNLIKQFLSQLEQKVIANLGKLKGSKAYDLFDEDAEIKSGVDLFTPIMNSLSKDAAQSALKLLGDSGHNYTVSVTAKSRIDDNVAKFTKSMVQTDRDRLSNIIHEGFSQGSSVPDIRNQISAAFDGYSKNQSQLIARTELLRSSNLAQFDAWASTGYVDKAQWLVDGNPCPECEAVDGDIVELGSSFFDDSWGDGESPPLHPNCECTLIPVIDDTPFSGVGAVSEDDEAETLSFEKRPIGTLFHGEGGGKYDSPTEQRAFGEGVTYFSRTPGVAAEHGEVAAWTPKGITNGDIYQIANGEEYQKFINKVIKEFPDEPYDTAAPKWLLKHGYKGAEIAETDDPQAGIGILDKYLGKFGKSAKQQAEYTKELERLLGIDHDA